MLQKEGVSNVELWPVRFGLTVWLEWVVVDVHHRFEARAYFFDLRLGPGFDPRIDLVGPVQLAIVPGDLLKQLPLLVRAIGLAAVGEPHLREPEWII